MKAITKLAKDVALLVLGYFIMRAFLFISGEPSSTAHLVSLLCSGVAIGWGLASNIISACGLWGIFIKFALSVPIGIFAAPFVLIKDIINVFIERRNSV